MAVVLYKGDEMIRVAIRSVKAHLDQGWSYTREEPGDDELERLRDEYNQKFGKKPHAAMKVETLRAKLEEPGDD